MHAKIDENDMYSKTQSKQREMENFYIVILWCW